MTDSTDRRTDRHDAPGALLSDLRWSDYAADSRRADTTRPATVTPLSLHGDRRHEARDPLLGYQASLDHGRIANTLRNASTAPLQRLYAAPAAYHDVGTYCGSTGLLSHVRDGQPIAPAYRVATNLLRETRAYLTGRSYRRATRTRHERICRPALYGRPDLHDLSNPTIGRQIDHASTASDPAAWTDTSIYCSECGTRHATFQRRETTSERRIVYRRTRHTIHALRMHDRDQRSMLTPRIDARGFSWIEESAVHWFREHGDCSDLPIALTPGTDPTPERIAAWRHEITTFASLSEARRLKLRVLDVERRGKRTRRIRDARGRVGKLARSVVQAPRSIKVRLINPIRQRIGTLLGALTSRPATFNPRPALILAPRPL